MNSEEFVVQQEVVLFCVTTLFCCLSDICAYHNNKKYNDIKITVSTINKWCGYAVDNHCFRCCICAYSNSNLGIIKVMFTYNIYSIWCCSALAVLIQILEIFLFDSYKNTCDVNMKLIPQYTLN